MEKFIDKLTRRLSEYIETETQYKVKLNTSEISIRQQLILNKLRKGDFSLAEILGYLEIESDLQSLDLMLSKRTFQRDLKTIYSVYGVEILYDRAIRKYKIVNDEQSVMQQRLLEAVDLYNALSLKEKLSDRLIFEVRKPQGTQYLITILNAIKNKKQIQFDYQKFWNDKPECRYIEPNALKEHNQRWYIVGNDVKSEKPRIFGLDRISNIETTSIDFKLTEIDVLAMFKDSFGIISSNNESPINIELTFNSFQARYVKSLPLHHSQQIIKEDTDKVVFSLFLVSTLDFRMELLSFGSSLIDIKPESLKNEIINQHEDSLTELKN